MSNDRLVCLGVISGAFGVRGEVRIKSFTEPPENIADYDTLIADPGGTALRITALRPVKAGFAARIESVRDRDAAEALRGIRLCVERAALPAEEEDEYYHVDLIGCRAESESGRELGTVTAVHDFGGGPLLEVGERGRTELFAFTREMVPKVDIAGKRIVIAEAALDEAEEDGKDEDKAR